MNTLKQILLTLFIFYCMNVFSQGKVKPTAKVYTFKVNLLDKKDPNNTFFSAYTFEVPAAKMDSTKSKLDWFGYDWIITDSVARKIKLTFKGLKDLKYTITAKYNSVPEGTLASKPSVKTNGVFIIRTLPLPKLYWGTYENGQTILNASFVVSDSLRAELNWKGVIINYSVVSYAFSFVDNRGRANYYEGPTGKLNESAVTLLEGVKLGGAIIFEAKVMDSDGKEYYLNSKVIRGK
ncbi:MAG: hypothetical protein Q8M29_17825 [Bacteroidota bacterium]|nr:hypothetical protein [Bacteroidota bacterium]